MQIRNKLNQEQNSKLQQQKELLNKRNMEVTLMDKRISELRERLYKKKAEARQKENLPVRPRANTVTHPSPFLMSLLRCCRQKSQSEISQKLGILSFSSPMVEQATKTFIEIS